MTRKPTPEELQKAYKDLELPPGAGPKEVKKMYRFLSYMFSADRVQQSPQSFIDRATEKHKAINNAKDILDEHFKNWHRDTDCDCQEPDPKIYEQKAKAAEERFEQEREAARQRAAQEAAEREARAQDAARRRQQADEEQTRQAEETANAARTSQFVDQFAEAEKLAKRVSDHEKLAPYTILSLKVFGGLCLGLALHLWFFTFQYDSAKNFKDYETSEYKALSDLESKYEQDKTAYLKQHIDKNVLFDSRRLHPPFKESYLAILDDYWRMKRNETYKPPPVQVDTRPKLSYEDRRELDSLAGLYETRAKRKAVCDKLSQMISDLQQAEQRARTSYEKETIQNVLNQANTEFRGISGQYNFGNDRITDIEKRLLKKYGSNLKLPPEPKNVTPYVINSENAYQNAKVNFPHLF